MTKRSAISHSGSTPAGAARFWRSLDERQDAERRLESATREPEVEIDASMLVSLGKKKPPSDGVGRRQFLTVGGASAAALGLSGCLRRPVENILPYSRQPEYVLPGIPLHYATVLPRRGDAIGILVVRSPS
jgi:molybdopterin-containing oxidoreductase family iron-sulfur binding subunit